LLHLVRILNLNSFVVIPSFLSLLLCKLIGVVSILNIFNIFLIYCKKVIPFSINISDLFKFLFLIYLILHIFSYLSSIK